MRKYLAYDPQPTHIAGGIFLLSTVSADCLTPASAQGRAAGCYGVLFLVATAPSSPWLLPPTPIIALSFLSALPSKQTQQLGFDTFVLFINLQRTRTCNINLNASSRPSRGLHIFPLTINSIEMIESPNLLLFN